GAWQCYALCPADGQRLALLVLPEPGVASSNMDTHDLKTRKPADVGMDDPKLLALDRDCRAGKYGFVDAKESVRKGAVVADATYPCAVEQAYAGRSATGGMHDYYDPAWHPYYQQTGLHTMQSATKTITSIVIGVARFRGDFPDLETPALDLLQPR